MPTIVVNARIQRFDVYIGRPSKWSNPYSHLSYSSARYKVRTRDEAISYFREWIKTQRHLMASLHELKDKRLGCPGCNPDEQMCHGHILAELADALPEDFGRERSDTDAEQ